MKIACSLETVELKSSGPSKLRLLSKGYWIEFFQWVAAAGFTAVELPYNPFNNDPLAFEIGRCGVPISLAAVNVKYGSPKEFRRKLADFGLADVSGVHVQAVDALAEILATDGDTARYFGLLESMGREAVGFLADLGSTDLVVSPTPPMGLVERCFAGGREGWETGFLDLTAAVLNKLAREAKAKGVRISVRNEFWSLLRGTALDAFLARLDKEILYSPDLSHLQIAGDDPVTVLKAHQGRLASVRFNDTFFQDVVGNYRTSHPEIPIQGAQRVFCDLGDGKVDLRGAWRVLADAKFDGWVVFDSRMTLDVPRALLRMRWRIDHAIAAKA